ncbi:hypothetical protein ACFQ73_01975 [Amycolatopsis japonica]|uniref:hypothetical protein n=1 Tax=Amycolatopsis japonica TaxID=208439 RepID=UPI00366D3D0C
MNPRHDRRLILATDDHAVLLPLHLLDLADDLDIVATVAHTRTALGLPVCPPLGTLAGTGPADRP